MVFYPVTILLLLLTFVVQEFVPGIDMAHHATLLLPPVFFFTAAVAVPFPMMLLLAFITGFLWDARHLPTAASVIESNADSLISAAVAAPEIVSGSGFGLGISIVVFALLGTFLQGVRPLFKRGRVELPVLLVGFTTFVWLLLEYLMQTFLRGSLFFPTAVWTKMVTDTMLAMLASPLLFLMLYSLAGLSRYEIKYDGLKYSFDGR
jgi:hypothetical protein